MSRLQATGEWNKACCVALEKRLFRKTAFAVMQSSEFRLCWKFDSLQSIVHFDTKTGRCGIVSRNSVLD